MITGSISQSRYFTVDVVGTNVPFPLCIDNIERHRMVLYIDKCMLSSILLGWTVPLGKRVGNL